MEHYWSGGTKNIRNTDPEMPGTVGISGMLGTLGLRSIAL